MAVTFDDTLSDKPNFESKSTEEEQPIASDADEDDGDISLVGSPKASDVSLAGPASTSHRRIDSVPPKKYSVSRDPTSALTASLASTSLQNVIQEEEADMSIPHYDDSVEVDLASRSASPHPPTAQHDELASHPSPVVVDKADLNFVDITLDAPEDDASLSRGSLGPSGVSSRSTLNKNGLSITPAPVLLAADENGNISVIPDSLISPRSAPKDLAPNDAEPSQSAQSDEVATSLSEEVEAVEAAASAIDGEAAPSSSTPPNGANLTTTTSPGLTDKADQVDPASRRKSSSASSHPVDSRTRMTTLPAKPKTEEIKHRADFERMMIAAKEAERKKREDDEERRRQRQDEQREALGRWEKEILPSWSRARKDAELEQLWWKGVPPSIRGRVWALAIGNPLMLSRSLLEQTERKAAGSESIIPRRVLDQIEEDVEETLPSLRLFQANGPLHDDLVRICRAFVLVRIGQLAQLDLAGNANKAAAHHHAHSSELPGSGEVDNHYEPQDEYARRGIDIYQPGLASLAGVLLINMSVNTAFIALLNLIESKPWLKALYSLLPTLVSPSAPSSPVKARASIASTTRTPGGAYTLAPKEKAIRSFERVLETLLGDQMPKAYANLLGHNVRLYRVVLRDWVSTLWARWLDVDTVMRIWDVVLLDETDSVIYRVCLALVQTLESRLYVPDQAELESILRGTNRAALGVWRREKEMKGELEVHARGMGSPTKRRSSVSNTSREALQSAPSASSLASDEVEPPRRSSSLTHPEPADAETEQVSPRDYIYEQYNIEEHHIFDTLEAQRSWWKQSTLQRLLERELSE
uniref:Rab-GAP TBC domain-containing protein n=1 Tax=Kalmanozyma brasiliensis (strain GHG001) TaxID=1365824 RepID=V5GG18_KALBG